MRCCSWFDEIERQDEASGGGWNGSVGWGRICALGLDGIAVGECGGLVGCLFITRKGMDAERESVCKGRGGDGKSWWTERSSGVEECSYN